MRVAVRLGDEAELTTRCGASYDRIFSSRAVFCENWSNLGVSRSRPMPMSWLGILVLTGILSLLAATRPAQAGCHASDRPVLGITLSWEQDQDIHLSSSSASLGPPILSHLPCPAEIPHVRNSLNLSVGPAGLAPAGFDPSTLSESLWAEKEIDHLDPREFRLDRPPRPFEPHVTIEWSA
jgi:hypothetical protein